MNRRTEFLLHVLRSMKHGITFKRSDHYWHERYLTGGDSGEGSYGELARFKAGILNGFVRDRRVASVLEFGCGDGNQLSLAEYPRYTGFDVSSEAVEISRSKFAHDTTKEFLLSTDAHIQPAELVLSLDVIYHLVENDVFESYMRQIFSSSLRFVIIYSSNMESSDSFSPHVRHREFVRWIDINFPSWELIETIPNRYPVGFRSRETSFAHFFIFELQCKDRSYPV